MSSECLVINLSDGIRHGPVISVPVVLAGTSSIPPATAVNYIPWALIGFIFNFVIRRRHFNWWAKYNCES
jgi:hypothetical protein